MKQYQKLLKNSTLALALSFFAFTVQGQMINTDASTVNWTGYHLAKSYEHVGQVKIKSGEVKMENGSLVGGKVVIDMTSISNEDLEGDKNTKLVNHLKSDDFFNAEKFPEAILTLNKVAKSGDGYNVSGESEIRGIKQPVEFQLSQSGKEFSGKLSVDRTKHEVMYGWTLENAMLGNNFDLAFKIVVE